MGSNPILFAKLTTMKEDLLALIETIVVNQYQLSNCVAYEKLVSQLFERAKDKFLTNEPEARQLKSLALELQEKAKVERSKWEDRRKLDVDTWKQIEDLLDKSYEIQNKN